MNLAPIGVMHTPYREKFGTPRQSSLVPAATGILRLNADPQLAAAVEGLEEFSHLWIIFLFDRHADQPWHPKITTPRTEIEKVGVFASRSPHRPNPIGISAVKLERIERKPNGTVEIICGGVDLLDGTPVLDIKPYVPYCDSIPGARAAWAAEPVKLAVEFSAEARALLAGRPAGYEDFLAQTLALDPRPRSQKESMPFADPANEGKVFRFRVGQDDVEWQIRGGKALVLRLLPLT